MKISVPICEVKKLLLKQSIFETNLTRIVGLLPIALLSAIPCMAQTSGSNWIAGKVTAVTSTPDGIMVSMSSQVPTNCTGSPYGWMLISRSYPEMVSVTLSYILAGKMNFTVYTSPSSSGGFCAVNQVQPQSP